MVSIRFVDVPKRTEAINIDRPHGAEPFGPREVTLMKILHDEIAPLIGVRLATEDHLSRDGLSKRLRETLSLLLDGRSEKEVASALRLGSRTIHDYVTALYQHFHVSSRAELLAYFTLSVASRSCAPPRQRMKLKRDGCLVLAKRLGDKRQRRRKRRAAGEQACRNVARNTTAARRLQCIYRGRELRDTVRTFPRWRG